MDYQTCGGDQDKHILARMNHKYVCGGGIISDANYEGEMAKGTCLFILDWSLVIG